ncbi:MAG: response regulator, partial [Oscillospiraceae bacterium]
MINHKNKKIVIIDDEFYFRQSLIKILREESQRLGIEFVGDANNGDTGYELVRAQKPDIVLVDINMPGLDGLQLLEKLRSQNVHCEMIIISGYANFEYAKRAIPLGVNNYLLKP